MSQITSRFLNSMIGRYKVEERLGSGGMATVFKAVDTNLDRAVAIKILHEHLVYEATFRERFEQEAKLVASLNHPNIIQLFDFAALEHSEAEAPLYYMVMPFIPGQTLEDKLNVHREMESRMPEQEVKQVMLDLLSALQYAHERGMIHRDVKPANVLFDEHGRAILTDFGIARLAESSRLTQEGITVGTPAYMSPEQATGVAFDYRTDLYAIGVMLYEMLSGKLPYTSENNISVLLQHVNQPIPMLSLYLEEPNLEFDHIIKRAMAKEPSQRYESAGSFSVDIKAAFSGQQVARQPDTHMLPTPTVNLSVPEAPTQIVDTVPQPVRQSRQSPLGILAIGLTVIVVITFLGLLSRQLDRNEVVVNTPAAEAVESMTGEDFYFESTFDVEDTTSRFWDLSTTSDIQRNVTEDGILILTNLTTDRATTTLFEPMYTYDNFSITMEVTLSEDSRPSSGYGIIFRYLDAANYNVFAIDGLGRYSIWVRESGTWYELRNWVRDGDSWIELSDASGDWTESSAIDTIGNPNTVTIEVYNNILTGIVNGEVVVEIEDTTFESGAVGIYLATPDRVDANTEIEVDSFAISELVLQTESMTGDDPSAESMTGDDDEEAPTAPDS